MRAITIEKYAELLLVAIPRVHLNITGTNFKTMFINYASPNCWEPNKLKFY